jgi:hypothetical protein
VQEQDAHARGAVLMSEAIGGPSLATGLKSFVG